jgi:ribosomal protein S18 acetylase RimI-like enzyme
VVVEDTTMGFDRRLQRYLRRSAARGREVVPCGPFEAFFHPRDGLKFLNYAVPVEGQAVGIEEARELVSVFAARRRVPRLEFVESEAPGLAAVLEAAGYELEARLDLMTCVPSSLRLPPGPAGLRLEVIEGEHASARLLRATQRAAFGAPSEGGDEGMGASIGILATLDGEPAAGGVFTAPEDGLTELAGIGTLEPFRRRGIAAALTGALAAEAFSRGVETAFLTPGDDDTRRVYERAGFSARSVVLAYSRG